MGEKKAEPVVYVGPQFRDSELRTYKVYPSIPTEYREDPVYKHLFAPLGGLADARARLRKKGSALFVFYKEAEAAHSKKKEG